MIYIGIDPGKKTGFAVWNGKARDFEEIETFDFWGAIYRILDWKRWPERTQDLCVVIEATHLNPSMHAKTIGITKAMEHLPESARMSSLMKIAQNVGGNKREAELFVEFAKKHDIMVIEAKPTRKSVTKITAEKFKIWTGWDGRTNEHSRDAAMLVFGK